MGVLGGAAAFPGHGRLGLAALAAGLLCGRLETAWAPSAGAILAWWGLAVTLDALAHHRRGESVLADAPDAFVWMAVLSIFLGVGFEWAAGRLAAWSYLGLPADEFLRYGAQGATLAAYLPALHGAAGALGAGSSHQVADLPKSAGVVAALLGAGVTAATLGVGAPVLSGLFGLLPLALGLWSCCDGINALRSRPTLLAGPKRELAMWSAAGLALTAGGALIAWTSGQGRYPAGFESPSVHEYALLVFLGPALRAAYLFLADSLGLPAWPGRENRSSLIR